jgi:hypothetical protein
MHRIFTRGSILRRIEISRLHDQSIRRRWTSTAFALVVATIGCQDASSPSRIETVPLESSNVVAQAESWQVQVLVNANCSPLTASALNDNETVVGRCRLPNNSSAPIAGRMEC